MISASYIAGTSHHRYCRHSILSQNRTRRRGKYGMRFDPQVRYRMRQPLRYNAACEEARSTTPRSQGSPSRFPPPLTLSPLFGPTMPAGQQCSFFVTPITEPPRFFSTFVLCRVWAQGVGVPCWRSVGGLPQRRAFGGGVLNPAWSGHSPTRRLAPWRIPV